MVRTVFAFIFAASLVLAAPSLAEEGFKFRTDPQIKQITPGKPLKIKLKRYSDGKYTWEISGDSVEEVTRADEELRKKFGAK